MRQLALLLAGLALAACEVPLDPIEPSDLYFSMSGYLDASADTQWVRVEPVARTVDPNAEPLDVVVTLTDEAAGQTVPLAQEVRPFLTGPAHLFWTTRAISLGGHYQLAARRPDGAETTTDVQIPADGSFSVDVVTGRETCPTIVTVSGAERVVEVQARYVVRRDGREVEYRFSHADTFEELGGGAIQASIYYADDAIRMGLDPLLAPDLAGVLVSDVVVGVSTNAWPNVAGLTLEDFLQVEGFGVENGLGFVGGAVTERRPFVPGVVVFRFGAEIRPCTKSSS